MRPVHPSHGPLLVQSSFSAYCRAVFPRRFLSILLALLLLAAGGPVAGGLLFCDAVDHGAIESVAIGGHCDDAAAQDENTGRTTVAAAEVDCVDTAISGAVGDRPLSTSAELTASLPSVRVVAVLPEPPGFWSEPDARVGVLTPPHLLPLRSFILLT